MTKAESRQAAKVRRAHLSEDKRRLLSEELAMSFKAWIKLENVSHILVYLPLHQEPDTEPIARFLQESYPDIQLSVPKTLANGELIALQWNPDAALEEGVFGTRHPEQEALVNPLDLDLMLIPLLAFDTQGHRVGYGKGYYDRFLARCRPDATKLGVSFFGPDAPFEDVWEGDVPLDACLTTKQLYNF